MSKLTSIITPLAIVACTAVTVFATTASASFAPGTETMVIQQQDKSLERVATRLFRTAVEKFDDKAYWHATRELIILLDYYPSFSKTDGVLYYLGESLYNMEMYKSAANIFRYMVTNYPQSAFLPKSLLSLQKLHYNVQEIENSLNYFVGLTTRFPDDDVLDGAYYYGGMAYFHQKNYDEAIKALGRVRSRSDYYDYGLYAVGLSFLKKKNIQQSVKVFRKLTTLPVLKDERQDVITAAHLTLGYIYYELGFFQEAIKHFSNVPQDDDVYKEALLAVSWSAIKLNNYQQAIITLNELVKIGNEEKYTEEAHFLLGQCYLELGFYDFAINEFDVIIDQFPGNNGYTERIIEVEAGMLQQRKMAEQLRVDLLLLETKLLDLIPLDHLSRRQSVPKHIEEEKKKIDETRDSLVQLILDERKTFDEFQWGVEEMQDEIARKSSRKHWRAYAEYGKARCFFLKTMPSN